MRGGFDAVLFDLDGTILDSGDLIADSYRHTLQVHGIPVPPEAELRAGIGPPLAQHFATWVDDPVEIAAMIETYRVYNLAVHDERVRAFPGIGGLVDALHARGTRLAIVTSKARTATMLGLEFLGMVARFPVVVCWDDVTRHKPDPESVHLALGQLGVAPERAVMVGDTAGDVLAGRAAGVRTAGVTWGIGKREVLARAGADVLVDDAAALRKILLD